MNDFISRVLFTFRYAAAHHRKSDRQYPVRPARNENSPESGTYLSPPKSLLFCSPLLCIMREKKSMRLAETLLHAYKEITHNNKRPRFFTRAFVCWAEAAAARQPRRRCMRQTNRS